LIPEPQSPAGLARAQGELRSSQPTLGCRRARVPDHRTPTTSFCTSFPIRAIGAIRGCRPSLCLVSVSSVPSVVGFPVPRFASFRVPSTSLGPGFGGQGLSAGSGALGPHLGSRFLAARRSEPAREGWMALTPDTEHPPPNTSFRPSFPFLCPHSLVRLSASSVPSVSSVVGLPMALACPAALW
jgi:hypothetical protein